MGYANTITDAKLYASGAYFWNMAGGDHRTLGLVTHATFGSEGLIKRGSSSGVFTYNR